MEEVSVANAKKRLKTKSKGELVLIIISLLQDQTGLNESIKERIKELDNVNHSRNK